MIAQLDTCTEEERLFLLSFEDDTERAPWMVNSDYQRLAITGALYPLERFAAAQRPDWYVSSDLAVIYRKPNGKKGQIAPDVMVALAHNHPRSSFDVAEEGAFPAFVLEVVSTESRTRDTGARRKPYLYGLLGAREYAIFDPIGVMQPCLRGYHRTLSGGWEPWPTGARGELWSAVLGLTLVPEGTLLRLEDASGRRLPTAEEMATELEALRARMHGDAHAGA